MLTRQALRGALLTALLLLLVASTGALVRVLPWLLDPSLPARVTVPFARSLLVLALEAALLVGWPLGWGLATASFVERGEARVLATLGEPPSRTVLRLATQGAGLAMLLGTFSLYGGRDANAPGEVVAALLEEGRLACRAERARATHVVPLARAAWVCVPGRPPRLVGRAPTGLGAAFSASRASVSGDLGRIELDDARLAAGPVHVHVQKLVLRGIPPFARASALPAWLRALVLVAAAALSAGLAVHALLVAGVTPLLRLRAVLLAVTGPLAALFVLRALETRGPPPALYVLVPVAALATSILGRVLLSRLPRTSGAGTR